MSQDEFCQIAATRKLQRPSEDDEPKAPKKNEEHSYCVQLHFSTSPQDPSSNIYAVFSVSLYQDLYLKSLKRSLMSQFPNHRFYEQSVQPVYLSGDAVELKIPQVQGWSITPSILPAKISKAQVDVPLTDPKYASLPASYPPRLLVTIRPGAQATDTECLLPVRGLQEELSFPMPLSVRSPHTMHELSQAMEECLEHRIIRNNLADITRLISSDPSAGPTWLAQKLEKKAFIPNAASAVVLGYSNYQQTSKLMEAVKGKISTSQEPGKEFAKFLEILQSNPQLVDLAKKLLKEYGTCKSSTGMISPREVARRKRHTSSEDEPEVERTPKKLKEEHPYSVQLRYSPGLAVFAVSLYQELYLKNLESNLKSQFPDHHFSLQSKQPVYIYGDAVELVIPEVQGWIIRPSILPAKISRSEVDLALIDPNCDYLPVSYPPRIFLTITPSAQAADSVCVLHVKGFQRDLSFLITLSERSWTTIPHTMHQDLQVFEECQEHKIIRINLDRITRLISSDSSGPTWFAQKLEEKAFIANAAGAVVKSYTDYQQTSKLMEAVKGGISTSHEPRKEFEKFLGILQSSPRLEGLAKTLLEEYRH